MSHRHAVLLLVLGAALVAGCDEGNADDEAAFSVLTVEIFPTGMPSYTFTGDVVTGVSEPGLTAIAGGVGNDYHLLIAVTDDGVGTYAVSTEVEGPGYSTFTDRLTFSEEDNFFRSTSGTFSISRWDDPENPDDETWSASGSFDIEYTNAPWIPNPPVTLRAVGEFANVGMRPLPESLSIE